MKIYLTLGVFESWHSERLNHYERFNQVANYLGFIT